ncbi:MAG: galactokinase [bacterium]
MAKNLSALEASVRSGALDGKLRQLYALDGREESLSAAKERILSVIETFRKTFSYDPEAEAILVSGPGRTELAGNHTDHQHGHGLCASVDLDILGCAVKNGEGIVRVHSYGHHPAVVDLRQLEKNPAEEDSSVSLVRGVCARLTQMGYTPCGVDVYTVSAVPSGSGVSSSAAFESLLGNLFNHFVCGGALSSVEIAKISQYAENVYFGKPCGIMDQMGASVGGAVAVDFRDPAAPEMRRADYDFTKSGHALCIIDTASTHSDLTDEYAAITREMGLVAAFFGKKVLREVDEADFMAQIPALRQACGDRAVLRAMHYYADDKRAVAEAEALEKGDFARFLQLVNASGRSSVLCLQNIFAASAPQQQAVTLSLALAEGLLEGTGAVRVHGGGFAGTIQAYVPLERLDAFKAGMERVLGEGRCHVIHIRPIGGCVIG